MANVALSLREREARACRAGSSLRAMKPLPSRVSRGLLSGTHPRKVDNGEIDGHAASFRARELAASPLFSFRVNQAGGVLVLGLRELASSRRLVDRSHWQQTGTRRVRGFGNNGTCYRMSSFPFFRDEIDTRLALAAASVTRERGRHVTDLELYSRSPLGER